VIIKGMSQVEYIIDRDNQVESCPNLPLIITISDTGGFQMEPKRLDSDNQINLSRLIVILCRRQREVGFRGLNFKGLSRRLLNSSCVKKFLGNRGGVFLFELDSGQWRVRCCLVSGINQLVKMVQWNFL
jgi:hypothetical protein